MPVQDIEWELLCFIALVHCARREGCLCTTGPCFTGPLAIRMGKPFNACRRFPSLSVSRSGGIFLATTSREENRVPPVSNARAFLEPLTFHHGYLLSVSRSHSGPEPEQFWLSWTKTSVVLGQRTRSPVAGGRPWLGLTKGTWPDFKDVFSACTKFRLKLLVYFVDFTVNCVN